MASTQPPRGLELDPSSSPRPLVRLAQESATAYMCAERLWWQCHRRLVSDALRVRGIEVVHILEAQKSEQHSPTPFLRVENGRLLYPERNE